MTSMSVKVVIWLEFLRCRENAVLTNPVNTIHAISRMSAPVVGCLPETSIASSGTSR